MVRECRILMSNDVELKGPSSSEFMMFRKKAGRWTVDLGRTGGRRKHREDVVGRSDGPRRTRNSDRGEEA